jgi:arginine deiminase
MRSKLLSQEHHFDMIESLLFNAQSQLKQLREEHEEIMRELNESLRN